MRSFAWVFERFSFSLLWSRSWIVIALVPRFRLSLAHSIVDLFFHKHFGLAGFFYRALKHVSFYRRDAAGVESPV